MSSPLPLPTRLLPGICRKGEGVVWWMTHGGGPSRPPRLCKSSKNQGRSFGPQGAGAAPFLGASSVWLRFYSARAGRGWINTIQRASTLSRMASTSLQIPPAPFQTASTFLQIPPTLSQAASPFLQMVPTPFQEASPFLQTALTPFQTASTFHQTPPTPSRTASTLFPISSRKLQKTKHNHKQKEPNL